MHPNAQVVMNGFQAFAKRDMAGLKDGFANDITWHTGGNHKWSGDHHGADTVVRLIQDLADEAELTTDVHSVLADDEHVVVMSTSTITWDGKSHTGNTVYVFHVDNGKMTEAWVIQQDQAGVDEFWAD